MSRARPVFVRALRVQLLWVLHCQLAGACGSAERSSSFDTSVLCRSCGHELASGADIRFVPSRLALSTRNDTLVNGRRVSVQLFENPHGVQFEVVTFRKADVTTHWPADTRFSWFPGFSWAVATCPRCRAHVGWAFEPAGRTDTKPTFEGSKNTFVALITQQILTEDFAAGLLMTPKAFVS